MSEEVKVGTVGGEALMEGIMMRSHKGAAMSVRLPNGDIETTLKKTKSPAERCKILGWPLIRGPVTMIYSMVFGYKCMMESAEKATAGLMEEAGEEEELGKLDRWLEEHFGPKMMAVVGVIGTLLGLLLAVGLFLGLPTLLFNLLARLGNIDNWRAVIEGCIRIVIFVGYMFLMSQLKDIRRVFMYHGAEHKSIYCYEFGLPLTVENVKKQSRLHPRCGTSFLFVILLLGMVVSAVLLLLMPWLKDNTWLWIGVKVLQFPIIMAFGYEFNRFAGKHLTNPFIRALAAPGLLMQRITTKEPDDGIIEVGIVALKAALGMPFEPLIHAEKEDSQDDDPACDAAGGEASAE